MHLKLRSSLPNYTFPQWQETFSHLWSFTVTASDSACVKLHNSNNNNMFVVSVFSYWHRCLLCKQRWSTAEGLWWSESDSNRAVWRCDGGTKLPWSSTSAVLTLACLRLARWDFLIFTQNSLQCGIQPWSTFGSQYTFWLLYMVLFWSGVNFCIFLAQLME